MAIRIVLAEDHVMTRQGLRALLERQEDFEVVGEASDGREAIAMVKEMQPHVVVMDISMPHLNGVEATHHIRRECPDTRVVILSMHGSRQHIMSVLKAGAAGYVLKESPVDDLVIAIRTVVSGGTFLSPKVTTLVTAGLSSGPGDAGGQLTPLEREVLRMVSEGKTTKQIAAEIGKSSKAVEATRRRIAGKLGVSGTAEMVRAAIRKGLTSVEF
jgi:two-component system, NarL family, response regulator NreC